MPIDKLAKFRRNTNPSNLENRIRESLKKHEKCFPCKVYTKEEIELYAQTMRERAKSAKATGIREQKRRALVKFFL